MRSGCRQHLDGMGKKGIGSNLHDLSKDHEDLQVQQAKEAVRLYRYIKGRPEATRKEQPHGNEAGAESAIRIWTNFAPEGISPVPD
jgi:hypothetical protein